MGISDAVVDARESTLDTMQGLQRRMDSVEKDVLEVKAHLLSVQSGLLQMMADFREATAASQAAQQLQLQLLQGNHGSYGQEFMSPSDPEIVPGTSYLISPDNETSRFSEPGWLRRHLAGSQKLTGFDDAENVLVRRSNVPRASSAMEAVSKHDQASGAPPKPKHPMQTHTPVASGFSSDINVASGTSTQTGVNVPQSGSATFVPGHQRHSIQMGPSDQGQQTPGQAPLVKKSDSKL